MIDPALGPAIADLTHRLPAIGDPADDAALLALLRLLYATGRRDLPLGRLFEGHVDALQIVTRYGTAEQAARLAEGASAGAIVTGVWNADWPGEGLAYDPAAGTIHGGKSFASGTGLVSHALVTVDAAGGRQLILVDLARTPPAVDGDWWRVAGMQRSETHRVRWDHAAVAADDRIGAPGDYVREPWFGGGALRFAAVQAGGIAGLVDRVRDALVAADRAADPHQAGRLAALYAAAQAAAAAVRTAAACWFDAADDATRLAHVSAARAAVYAEGGRAIALAQEAVGLPGLFVAHPLHAALTDLMVYLRQPGPDAQRMRVGAAVAAGRLSPAL